MNKKDIVKFFLKEGVLLSPEETEKISEENYLEILKNKKDGEEPPPTKDRPQTTKKITPEDFIRTYNKKFEFLREILLKKTDAVSINKGRKIFSEVVIIGRVKEITDRGFLIEDVTGEVEVSMESKGINNGDVLGIRGFFKESTFFPKQIIWPDIPLETETKTITNELIMTTRIKQGMNGFVVCPDTEQIGGATTFSGNPGVVKISSGSGDITIIAYAPENKTSEDDAVMILKKRLIPGEEVFDNLIKEAPEIFWVFNNDKNWSRNYKGVVIISSDKNSFVVYDKEKTSFGKL